jgi:hypothetical protein
MRSRRRRASPRADDLWVASSQVRSLPAQVVRGSVFAVLLLSLRIVAIIGASNLRPAAHEPRAPQPAECPRTTPSDCARLSAAALRIPVATFPRIGVPAGLVFTSGSFTSIEGVTDEWLTFKDQATADTFVLIFHRTGPSDTLRPTNGRIEKVGGWLQQVWVTGRAGRRYLATIYNGQAKRYQFGRRDFTYMVRLDGRSITTQHQRDLAIRLLDAAG